MPKMFLQTTWFVLNTYFPSRSLKLWYIPAEGAYVSSPNTNLGHCVVTITAGKRKCVPHDFTERTLEDCARFPPVLPQTPFPFADLLCVLPL